MEEATKSFPDTRILAAKIASFLSYLSECGIDNQLFLARFPSYKNIVKNNEEFIPLSLWMDFNRSAPKNA